MSRSNLDTRDPRLARPPEPFADQARTLLERIASHGMTRVALAAFAFGLFLHVCVIYAVLDDGRTGGSAARPQPAGGGSQPAVAIATATPVRSSDRTSCDAIRGTDYRSESERQWFRSNCS